MWKNDITVEREREREAEYSPERYWRERRSILRRGTGGDPFLTLSEKISNLP